MIQSKNKLTGIRIVLPDKATVTVVASVVTLAVITTIIVISAFRRPTNIYPPPFHYANVVMLTPDICPGNAISFQYESHVDRAPSIVWTVSTVWDIQTNRTVVFDQTPVASIYKEPTVVRQVITFQLPQLSPGQYEYRRAAQEFNSAAGILVIPFTVRVCP